jgi:hypothetical protein
MPGKCIAIFSPSDVLKIVIFISNVKQEITNSDCNFFLMEGYHRMELV